MIQGGPSYSSEILHKVPCTDERLRQILGYNVPVSLSPPRRARCYHLGPWPVGHRARCPLDRYERQRHSSSWCGYLQGTYGCDVCSSN